jgi:hypothetical protein
MSDPLVYVNYKSQNQRVHYATDQALRTLADAKLCICGLTWVTDHLGTQQQESGRNSQEAFHWL